MERESAVLLAFASTREERTRAFLESLRGAVPRAGIVLVAEFPAPPGAVGVEWIPWFPGRTLGQNLARIRDGLRGRKIVWTALVLDREVPHWKMRAAALRMSRGRLLLFNEQMNHFALRPGDAPQALRWAGWRLREFLNGQTHPGGWLYTQVWRLRHPGAYRRPLFALAAAAGGRLIALRKRLDWKAPALECVPGALEEGVSIVIPTRDGRAMLERLLPALERELEETPGEILVVDNGSRDGTAEWLRAAHPGVGVIESAEPLGFAAAVNRGIAKVRRRFTLLLSNDMEPEPGFLSPLLQAFAQVPDLFCATAQILFAPGGRREETGKAVWRARRSRADFFVHCIEPLEGESQTPVLYGSGGCSMYDTAKLRALGGMDEAFEPFSVEDLDAGFRAWRQGWPSVFVGQARALHPHRATTLRHSSPEERGASVEINFLRFLARSVGDAGLFGELWREAADRLNWHAAQEPPRTWAMTGLRAACRAHGWPRRLPKARLDERLALAAGSGQMAVFPGRRRDESKPAILVLSAYPPWPLSHGGAVRMYNLMRRCATEFDQVLVAFAPALEPPAREILELCTEVIIVEREGSHMRPMTERPEMVEEHDQPAMHAAVRLALRKHRPKVAQVEFTHMGVYAGDCEGAPTLLVEHDITVDLYRQLLKQRDTWETREQWKRWERFERELWRRVDCVVTMSERDAGLVEGARRVEVIGNGVDIERFRPGEEPPEPRRLLFVGSFAHLPNLLGLEAFLRQAWPRLREAGAVLHVISGADPEHYLDLYRDRVQVDLRDPQIEWEAYVADVCPAYRRAEIVVAPLVASAGTNIKILEAMAMGKAIVATQAAVHGLDIRPGVEAVIVGETGEMAQAVAGLMESAQRRAELGRAARRKAETRYSWDAIARRQAELYRELARQAADGGAQPAAYGYLRRRLLRT